MDLLELILELLLLLSDQSGQELLLKTTLCDSEINNGSLGGELWGEMGVGKS